VKQARFQVIGLQANKHLPGFYRVAGVCQNVAHAAAQADTGKREERIHRPSPQRRRRYAGAHMEKQQTRRYAGCGHANCAENNVRRVNVMGALL
jgi:hypothetical protein